MKMNPIGLFASSLTILLLCSCGGESGHDGSGTPNSTPTIFTPVAVYGVSVDQGNFDPAPTTDATGGIWMSYSHVSVALSGISQVETRLATSTDGGSSWQDAGVAVNIPTSLPLPAPNDVNAVAHEVSRLVYDPYAAASGADPWILIWHRYLSVLSGIKTLRLFQHGWIAMKSGPSAMSLGNERKLFTGALYDASNNSDSFGAPEYPLDSLYPTALSDCDVFSEPGVLVKSNGIYLSLMCKGVTTSGKIVLLRCAHDLNSCDYLGDLIADTDASDLQPTYDGYSASELVSIGAADYLIVSPTISTSSLYRGCAAFKITDLDNAVIERNASKPLASQVIEPHGDFNGACGYVDGLSGSGILISEAFVGETPIFRLFATGKRL